MAEIVTMPRLSDTMTTGTVAKWHKKIGDQVEEGDLLAEIETDKATMEFESFQEGTLLYIGADEGNEAPVDSVLAILGEEGEDFKSLLEGAVAETAAPKEEKKEEAPAAVVEAPKAEAAVPPVLPAAQPHANRADIQDGRVKASPLAKKMAQEKGIDLRSMKGSGEGGRIVKRDIDSYTPAASAATSVVSISGEESYTEQPISQMRRTIARRLAESKFTAPHFYLTMEIDMGRAIEARKQLNGMSETKISFNDFVVKACAMALRKHPAVNSSWREDVIRTNEHVHIGVAVAVDEGLLVPVIRFADHKGLQNISAEVKDLAGRAKDKKLQPQDWEGNTFTISNLGMFGIEEFTAIVNPPDSCIMAVGGIVEKPVVKDGQIVVGHRMKVTLSCDHRVVDGASGAAFLQTVKNYLEEPVSMLL
jgi:pyruvate dehydrogenase E2 component (dihydrolipoamide acetyltransferase)